MSSLVRHPVRVQGSIVLVTGAAGSIGRCLVDALQAQGAAKIYAADLAATNCAQLRAHERIVPIDLDITDHAGVDRAAENASDVNLLFNNAGINLRSQFIGSPSMDSARREMETNYFGTLAMCRAFAPVLTRNAERGAAIVNVLSILAKITLPNLGTYCATKAALLRMTEGLRAELPAILVTAVMPWAVDTPISKPFPGSKTSPEEVAERTLTGIERGEEDIYLHEFSDEVNERLRTDPKALEHELAARFRNAR